MKIYNVSKAQVARRWERPIVAAVLVLRTLLLPVHGLVRLAKRLLRRPSPDVLVADGFLVGDAVLLRPLVVSLSLAGRSFTYLGGSHVDAVLGDLSPCGRVVYQWPWATYDRSPASWRQVIAVFGRLLLLTPRVTIEARGDLRSLAVLSAARCGRLVGFAFTGGRSLLDVDAAAGRGLVEREGHLDDYNRALAEACGLAYDPAWIAWRGPRTRSADAPIALALSGSQPFKVIPVAAADRLIAALAREVRPANGAATLVYLEAPVDHFLALPGADACLARHGVRRLRLTVDRYLDTIGHASAYIGMDSAGCHVASMFGTPTLACFAPGTTRVPASYARPTHDAVIILERLDGDAIDLACRQLGLLVGVSS